MVTVWYVSAKHSKTQRHDIVFVDIIIFDKYALSRFTRKIPILPAYTGKMGFWSEKYGMRISLCDSLMWRGPTYSE